MCSLFRSRSDESPLVVEPVATVFPTIQGAEVAAGFLGRRIAGDFYDSVRASSQRVLIGLLDVAGRRNENGHILAAAQHTFRNSGTELFSGSDINEADAMIELNLRINRAVIEVSGGVRSCPAFLACYHEGFGTICYSNAGHTPALLRDTAGITELGSTGLPLGLFSHATSDARIVAMAKGSALLVVSRGLTTCEGRHNSSEEFGLQRIKTIFAGAALSEAQELCTGVLNSVAEFSRGVPVCDDRTALALVRTS